MATIFCDESVLAVDKPAGVTVIPARDEPADDSLHKRLESERGERLWVVHRIDRETSGIVVFARNATAHRTLSMAFEHREVEKTYLCFAHGDVADGVVDVALHAARKGKTRPAVDGEPDAQAASTTVRVVKKWRGDGEVVSLVEARPHTGRHHQIRVHLRYRGAPLVADRLYGKHTLERGLKDGPLTRLALHASRLQIPALNLDLRAPLPADLRAFEEWLDKMWSVVA